MLEQLTADGVTLGLINNQREHLPASHADLPTDLVLEEVNDRPAKAPAKSKKQPSRTLEWVDWFNHRRLLEPIGNIPPAEAEDRYYAGLEQTHMMAA